MGGKNLSRVSTLTRRLLHAGDAAVAGRGVRHAPFEPAARVRALHAWIDVREGLAAALAHAGVAAQVGPRLGQVEVGDVPAGAIDVDLEPGARTAAPVSVRSLDARGT